MARQDPVRCSSWTSCSWTTFTLISLRPVLAAITGSGRMILRLEQVAAKPWPFAQLTYTGPACCDIETCLSVHRIETLSRWASVNTGPALDAGRCHTNQARLGVSMHSCWPSWLHHPGEDAVRRRRTGVLDLDQIPSTPLDFVWFQSLCACRISSRGSPSLPAPRKAAVKMHTLLDLRGNIPSFIHIIGWQAAST